VLTPAFVVPSSILLHLLSLRQLRRRSRASSAVAADDAPTEERALSSDLARQQANGSARLPVD
jgi:hypothetical protein